MTDPRTVVETLTKNERGWLRSIETALDIEELRLESLFDPARLRVARAAYRRLVA